MKKQFLTVAVAALALAGCSKNETVEVADSRAIGFESFVGKATRAVTDLNEGTNFNKFFVYGSYENGDSYVSVYDGEYVSNATGAWTNEKIQYWVANKAYKFAAYSNGNETVADVSFDDKTGSLTIPSYTVGDKDLIAVNNVEQTGAESGNTAVPLVFKHLLSKVKFTFSTTYNDDLTVTVSNLKFTAVNEGTWNGTWTPTEATGEKSYDDVVVTSAGVASEECYVLPQATTTLVASFTVTVTDAGGNKIAEKNFTDVKLDAGAAWAPGFAYNYSAVINPKNVDPDGSQSEPIVFNPSVGRWEDGIVNDDDILNE